MKVEVVAGIDLSTGDYTINIKNVSSPGERVEADILFAALSKIITDFERQVYGDASATNDSCSVVFH